MDCKERILSEDYLDLLADYDVMLRYGEVEGADYCYQKIDDELYVVYSSKKDVPGYDISLVRYESIPKCFGLMSESECEKECETVHEKMYEAVQDETAHEKMCEAVQDETAREKMCEAAQDETVYDEAQKRSCEGVQQRTCETAYVRSHEGAQERSWEAAHEKLCNEAYERPRKAIQDEVYDIAHGNVNGEAYDIEQSQMEIGRAGFNYNPLIESGIIETNNPPLSLTGQGVILAFIDTGIRYDLDVFKKPDGSSRILAIWDQTIQSGTPPEGFYYGTEYKKEQIDEALQADRPYEIIPSRDELGHGTKMASVAAGSNFTGESSFQGVSYDASLVVVKLKPAKQSLRDYFLIPPEAICYSETDILLALVYVQQFYQAFKRPVVICLGIGTSLGDHAGNSYFSNYLNRVARKRNVGLVVCGGNEGNTGGHFAGGVTGRGENSYQDVEIKVGENEFGFSLSLWGEIPNVFTVEIRSPDGEVIPRINYRIGQINTYRFLYSPTIVNVEYVFIEQSSGQQLIFFKFEKPLSGIWTIRVYAATDLNEANYNLWLPIKSFLRSDTYFISPNPYTTLTEPAYADNVISVSTYDSGNNSFYLRSGRGFGRNGEITPDISAPGVDISTTLGVDSGSSLAAAITAGAVANFLQWAVIEGNDTTVNSITIRNYLVRGAGRDANTDYPSREWGFGKLNLAGVFRALLV